MCANYHPVTAQDRLAQYFGVDRPLDAVPPDLYPGGLAPFIVRERDRVELARDVRMGLFGLLPHWAKDMAFGRRTYNARSETVTEKPSFRDAWRQGRRCVIPADADALPIFQRLHRPGEEKRMVVILDEADYDGWLEAPLSRVAEYLRPYPAELLQAEPAPRRASI